MVIGEFLSVSGCVTQEKFVAGRSAAELERLLGFQAGRLSQGLTVVGLLELPALDQFELAAYSNVATHRHVTPGGLDIPKLKKRVRANWMTAGPERLVKVLPTKRHNLNLDPDFQYPPGAGVPQWRVLTPLRGRVTGVVDEYPGGRYRAGGV